LHFINSQLKIKRLLILQEVPSPNEYASWFLFPFAFYNSLFDDFDLQYVQLCRFNGEVRFLSNHYYLERIYNLNDFSAKNESEFNEGWLFESNAPEEDNLGYAYAKARSARFEFGEKG
jgi:hypothetical protein